MSETQPLVGGEKGTTYATAPPPYSSSAPPPQAPYSGSAPPPQAPYPAPSQATTTTVITQPVVIQQQLTLGETPVTITCPNGGHQIVTNVSYKNGTLTFLLAALLCFLLGPCCALIPFCIDSVKDVEHTCPVDGTVIGVYKRM